MYWVPTLPSNNEKQHPDSPLPRIADATWSVVALVWYCYFDRGQSLDAATSSTEAGHVDDERPDCHLVVGRFICNVR